MKNANENKIFVWQNHTRTVPRFLMIIIINYCYYLHVARCTWRGPAYQHYQSNKVGLDTTQQQKPDIHFFFAFYTHANNVTQSSPWVSFAFYTLKNLINVTALGITITMSTSILTLQLSVTLCMYIYKKDMRYKKNVIIRSLNVLIQCRSMQIVEKNVDLKIMMFPLLKHHTQLVFFNYFPHSKKKKETSSLPNSPSYSIYSDGKQKIAFAIHNGKLIFC